MKRLGKIMLWLLLAVVVIILTTGGGACLLLASPKGLPWLVAGVEKLVPGFTAREVSGRFFSSWSLTDISYQQGDFSMVIDNLSLHWRGKELRHGLIHIEELTVGGIRLHLPAQAEQADKAADKPEGKPLGKPIDESVGKRIGGEKSPGKGPTPAFIPSWLRLRLDKLAIADARLSEGDHEVLALESISGGGEIDAGTVKLKDWRLAGKAAACSAEAIGFDVNLDASLADIPAPSTAQRGASIGLNSQIKLWPGRGFSPMTGILTAQGTLDKPEISLQLTTPPPAGSTNKPAPLTITAGAEHTDSHWSSRWRWHGQVSGPAINLTAINANWRPAQISLEVKASGLDTEYEATATGVVAVPGTGDGRFALALTGDMGKLTLKECRLDGAFGLLKAKGDFAWTDGLAWQGEIETDGFNPAFFAPDYTGALDMAVTTSGTVTGDSRVGNLAIDKLSGQVRGYPVTGGGGLHFKGDDLTIESLWLQSGKARLDVAGTVARQVDMTANLTVPNLSEALTTAAGSLEAKATVTGPAATPRLEAQITGRGLAFGGQPAPDLGLGLGLFSADFTGVWAKEKPADSTFSGRLQAERLSKGKQRLVDSLKLSLDGSLAKHQAGLSANGPLGEAALHLAGGIKEKSWEGAIDSLALANPHAGRWRQNGAARLTLAADKGELTDLSLSGGEGSFHLAGGFTSKDAARLWRLAINDSKLPLALLSELGLPMQEGDKKAAGSVALTLSAEGNGARLNHGQVSAHTSQADLPGIPVVPGFKRIRLGETNLDLTVNDGALTLGLQSHFNDDNELAANLAMAAPDRVFDLTNLPALAQVPLSGPLRLRMGDINFVGPLSHYTVMPSGAVSGDFAASGTPLHPRLIGKVTMPDNGQVEIISSGIDIKDVLIEADISADLAGLLGRQTGGDGLVLDLTAHGSSGPGRATAVGIIKFPPAAPFFGDFSVTGTDFEIFRRPEYRIRGNPDNVRMFFARDHGKLSGNVAVTWAEIAPEHIQSSVSASNDLIIADGEEHSGWLFLTDLRIHLGDEVHFTGYGLTGTMHGDLLVKTNDSGRFTGQGALQLADGDFTIYGRRLKIERGRLSFAGGAIDDPLIDARAQKQVFTKGTRVHEITVGVDVSGSAHEPEFQLFSSEPLDDREILTYLLSGTSASNDAPDESLLSSAAKALGLDDRANLLGGMGLLDEVSLERNEADNSMSLLVGKRLTNDLFIGYDQNFVGEGGAFKIRYNLGRGFTVETSSSGSISSADLFYSFEK